MHLLAMRLFCCSCSWASCRRDLLSLIFNGLGPALVELFDRVEAKLEPKCTVTRPDSPILVRREEKVNGRTWRLRSEVFVSVKVKCDSCHHSLAWQMDGRCENARNNLNQVPGIQQLPFSVVRLGASWTSEHTLRKYYSTSCALNTTTAVM